MAVVEGMTDQDRRTLDRALARKPGEPDMVAAHQIMSLMGGGFGGMVPMAAGAEG
jgi:hypothetical protein